MYFLWCDSGLKAENQAYHRQFCMIASGLTICYSLSGRSIDPPDPGRIISAHQLDWA